MTLLNTAQLLESEFRRVMQASGWTDSRSYDFSSIPWDAHAHVDWETPTGRTASALLRSFGGLVIPETSLELPDGPIYSVAFRFSGVLGGRFSERVGRQWWARQIAPFVASMPFEAIPVAMSFDRFGGDVDSVVFVSDDDAGLMVISGSFGDEFLCGYRGETIVECLSRCYWARNPDETWGDA
ncbi:MAG: hypothetical protein U0269_25870 [Polyangiales bacterium]